MTENLMTAWSPEFWAAESLITLQNNLVLARLVHRDFENEVASKGQTISTRKPATFSARTKAIGASVTVDDASADKYSVTLDTHAYVSFSVDDVTRATALPGLVETHIVPAMQALAQKIDTDVYSKLITATPHQFGTAGSPAAVPGTLTGGRKLGNILKWPGAGRNFVVGPTVEEIFLQSQQFTNTQYTADGGSALENATMGRKWGLDLYMDQNVETTFTQATASGYLCNGAVAAKDASITVDTGTGTVAAGARITIGSSAAADGSDDYAVTAVNGSSWTLSPKARKAYADNTPITVLNSNKTVSQMPLFQRESLALVCRPLPTLSDLSFGTSAVVSDGSCAMRAIVGFDQDKLGIRVTIDCLYGIAALDVDRCAAFIY